MHKFDKSQKGLVSIRIVRTYNTCNIPFGFWVWFNLAYRMTRYGFRMMQRKAFIHLTIKTGRVFLRMLDIAGIRVHTETDIVNMVHLYHFESLNLMYSKMTCRYYNKMTVLTCNLEKKIIIHHDNYTVRCVMNTLVSIVNI